MNFPTLVGVDWSYTAQDLDNNHHLLCFFHDGAAGNKSMTWRPDGTYRIKSLVYSSSIYALNEVFLFQVLCANTKYAGSTSGYLFQKYEQTVAAMVNGSYNGCVDLHNATIGVDNVLNINIFPVHACYATFLVERIPTMALSTDNVMPKIDDIPPGKCYILDWISGRCQPFKGG